MMRFVTLATMILSANCAAVSNLDLSKALEALEAKVDHLSASDDIPEKKAVSERAVSKQAVSKKAVSEQGIPAYGYYCGPSWCQAKFQAEGECGANDSDAIPAMDAFDNCCKVHDGCCPTNLTDTNICNPAAIRCMQREMLNVFPINLNPASLAIRQTILGFMSINNAAGLFCGRGDADRFPDGADCGSDGTWVHAHRQPATTGLARQGWWHDCSRNSFAHGLQQSSTAGRICIG